MRARISRANYAASQCCRQRGGVLAEARRADKGSDASGFALNMGKLPISPAIRRARNALGPARKQPATCVGKRSD